MNVINKGIQISEEELSNYVRYVKNKYSDRIINTLYVTVGADDYVDLECEFEPSVPFQRIRRITGYLVGTLDRFNDGKRAEESQRIKHTI